MAKNNVYPEKIKQTTKKFAENEEKKKLVDSLIKKIAKEETYNAFKKIGYTQKDGYYFSYAAQKSGEEKEGGKGTQEGKVNVTISYPKKYSDESSSPAISFMQKVTTFGGKKLVSEMYVDVKDDTIEITYKNTEDSAFHQQSDGPTYAKRKLDGKVSLTNVNKPKTLEKEIRNFFSDICLAEAEYLSGTKIGIDDRIEKKQNASTVMENKFKMSLKTIVESDSEEIGKKIYNMVEESIKDKKIVVNTDKGKKELLKGDEEKEESEKVDEITTSPSGIGGPFNGEINPSDENIDTSSGGSYATVAGSPVKRKMGAKGQDGEVVANQDNTPNNYRVNESIKDTPYGQMRITRPTIIREGDGTYVQKVIFEPGQQNLNVPKGMKKNWTLGLHDVDVNSKEELEKTGHGELSKLDEEYKNKIRNLKRKFVVDEENEKNNINKRYIITPNLTKEEEKRRFKELVETKSFKSIKEENEISGDEYENYVNNKFAEANIDKEIESDLESTPACGIEDGFRVVPKGVNSIVMFKLSESDIKSNKTYIKDHFTNKIVLNPLHK